MHNNLRRFVTTALLVAICLLLGLTPVGYIPVGPVSLTLMCLPVIIGTITQGFKTGLALALVFGFTSLFSALGITLAPSLLGTTLIGISVVKAVIVIFIPRLIIPMTTWLVYNAIARRTPKRQKLAVGAGAFVGSLTNTVLFLSVLYLLFLPEIVDLSAAFGTTPELFGGVLAGIGAINGVPEAVVAVILCIPIVMALNKFNKSKLEN